MYHQAGIRRKILNSKLAAGVITKKWNANMENSKPFLIVNPAASGGKTGKRWPAVKEELLARGLSFDSRLTGGPGDASALSRQALLRGHRAVIAVGGDGTLNEVANGFFQVDETIRRAAALGMIPMGTGADFARQLGISRDLESCAVRIMRGETCWIDMVHATYRLNGPNVTEEMATRYFCNAADVGLGGATVALTQKLRKYLGGFLSYYAAMVLSLVFYRSQDITVVIDGRETWAGKITALVMANGQYFGGGMKIAPTALPHDGLLDILLIAAMNKLSLLFNSHRVYKGTHLSIKEVQLFQGRTISIHPQNRCVLFQMDGEQLGEAPVEVRLLPGALRFIV